MTRADAAGWEVIGAAVAAARGRLGGGLVSAYAIGSLAHGGFAPAVSDVDLALLADDGTADSTPAAAASVAAEIAAGPLPLGDPRATLGCP